MAGDLPGLLSLQLLRFRIAVVQNEFYKRSNRDLVANASSQEVLTGSYALPAKLEGSYKIPSRKYLFSLRLLFLGNCPPSFR